MRRWCGGIVLWVVPSRRGGGSCFDCFAVLLVDASAADVILVVLIALVVAAVIVIAIAVLVGCRLTHQSSTDAKSLVV